MRLLTFRHVTSAETPEKQKAKPKRKWLKRFGWMLAALLLAAVVFHQPILMTLIRFAVARFAASQHMRIQYDLGGRAISGLVFSNVRVLPAGRSPVDTVTIERIRVAYSLFDLMRHGQQDFLKSVEVRNATIILKDIDDPSAKSRPDHLGDDMHTWFFPPVFLVGKLDVQNLNIVNHLDVGDFALESGSIYFERGKPGSLAIGRMKIPSLHEWKNIEGRLTVTGNELTIENLAISPDIKLERVVSSPSPGKGNSRLTVSAAVFGGQLTVDYSDTQVGDQFNATAHVTATKFGIEGLGKFLDSQVLLTGELDHIDAQCSGRPGIPSSWTGTSTAEISSPVQVGPVKLDGGNANLVLKNGTADLVTSLSSSGGKVNGSMHGKMPGRLREFAGMALDGQYQVAVSDLSRGVETFTHGAITGNGDFHLLNRQFQTEFVVSGTGINSEKFDASAIDLKGGFTKPIDSVFPGGITGRITAQFKDARLDKYALDSGIITAENKAGWLKLDATGLKRAENTASLTGNFQLPHELPVVAPLDFDLGFSVSAPNVAAFNAEPDLNGLNGELQASGTLTHRNDLYDGKIDIDGSKLVLGDLKAQSVKAGLAIEKSTVGIRDFLLVMDAKNRVAGSGSLGLARPFAYEGKVQAEISDVTVFDAFFATMGIFEPIGGSLTANWSGSGEIEGMHHRGNGQIQLTGGRYGYFQPITAQIAGSYSPEAIDIPALHIHVDKTDFVAGISLRDTELRVRDILLQQGKINLLKGEIMFPLDLRTPTNPASMIPPGGRVLASLSSDEINLETLLIRPKQTSPLKGVLKLSIDANGPLDDLPANAQLTIRNLQAKSMPDVAPGNLTLDADLKDNQLMLHGSFRQPVISPLLINGKLPFSLTRLLKEGKIDETSPIDLSITLDKSPATIIGQIEPRIRYIEGQIGIDAKATGTISKPRLSGSVMLDLPAIRLRDPTAPAVNGFKGNLEFTGDQLVIRRFAGEISGGPFDLTGRVLFEKLTSPKLDLRLTSQNALILRNETLTVRADADLRIAGLVSAANVAGSVGLTKSRFFRDVEILPISLPGKPAPKPPTELDTGFSLKPPFAKWTFNVALKTIDPILVRGNLANGSALIDLRLLGTGEAPTLEGMARIDNFVASLPFSRLNIEYGYAYFSADNPFVPRLDIQGTSSLRDYNIRVFITGTPTDPVTVLSSDPPLPQEQIVALLGTGATAQELTSNGDVLAGRAAILIVQDLYRKVFRKHKAKDNQSFLTRFELNPGAIDPRTGRQEVSARFKATDHVYFVGDLDDQGGMRGQVGYLIRFR